MGVQFEVEGVTVDFPFEPYPLQKEYMKRVILALKYNDNALLESPTGTGKTLCLLCATLAWKRHLKQASPAPFLSGVNAEGSSVVIHSSSSSEHASAASTAGRVTVSSHIIYAARTHSQLSQVAKELKNTTYATSMRILGSRQQFCRHEKVRSAPSMMQQPMCRALVHRRKCHLHKNLEAAGEQWKHEQDLRVHDIEDIIDFAERHRACGYYLSRHNLEQAEVILVPYNYVFDPNTRKMVGLDKLMAGAVVVLDEAHNLESFCCDSASLSLASGLLAHAIADMGLCKAKLNTLPTPKYTTSVRSMLVLQDEPMEVTVTAQVVDILATQLQRLEADMLALPTDVVRERDTGRNGRFLVGLVDQHFAMASMSKLLPVLEALQELLYSDSSADGSGSSGANASTAEGSAVRSGQGAHLLTLVQQLRMLHTLAQKENTQLLQLHYRCVVSREPLRRRGGGGGALEDEEVTVNMWCFHSGVAMRALVNFGVASIIVTSGTLAPLSSFAVELGVPFAQTLENSHVITEQQLLPMVLARGPAGALLNSSYKNRDDVSALMDAGAALVNVARMVPAGILVFFPSYAALERALGEWCKSTKATSIQRPFGANPPSRRESPPWESGDYPPDCIFAQLAKLKTLAVEPRGAASFGDTLIKYRNGISDGPGSVLFGVCRGKASEGIDFSNDMARAVLLMGIPYPALMYPRVVIKRNLMDELHDRARKDNPRDSARLRELGELIPRHVQNMDKLERALRETPMHSRAESERLLEHTRLKAMCEQLSAYQQERSLLQERVSMAAQTGDWYLQAAFRAVNQALGPVIRHRHDFGCVLLCDSRFAGTHMRRQVCQWLRPWIKDANTFPEAMRLLRGFWKETVPALRERLASAGVDVSALPALGGEDESPSASAPQETVFMMGKSVFKRIKSAAVASVAIQLPQPSLQLTRPHASEFLCEVDGLTSELGNAPRSTTKLAAATTSANTPLRPQVRKGSLSAVLTLAETESALAAPMRALSQTFIPATSAGDAQLLRLQPTRAAPDCARAPILRADRHAAAEIAAALPPLSARELQQHCGRIAWPLLLVVTPKAHIDTLRPLVQRLAKESENSSEDELARALVECVTDLQHVLALNKNPTQLQADMRHPYLEWRPSGERVASTDMFPQPATELPYASKLAYPHARPLACISRSLFLALLTHASSPHITSAVARVLAAHPWHSALHEDYTAACAWLEPEVRWSAHMYKEFKTVMGREREAIPSPVEVMKPKIAMSAASVLGKSDPADIKCTQATYAAPVAQPQPASNTSTTAPAKSAVQERVRALLASCLSPAQGTAFKHLLHELKSFKSAPADDSPSRKQCASIIARFQALFEEAPGSWELAEVMLMQIPPVCKRAWTDLVNTLKPK